MNPAIISKIIKTTTAVITIYIAYIFINAIFQHTLNFPKAQDDTYAHIHQFHKYILNGKWSISSVFKFIFSPTYRPHPGFFGRILDIISYTLFGSINFKFIQITCNFIYITSILSFYFVLNRKVYIIPIILVSLVPISLNYWTVSICNYPFFFLASFWFLQSLKNDYIIRACLLLIPIGFSFSLSPIFLFLTLIYFLQKNKRNFSTQHFLFILLNLFTIILVYSQLYDNSSLSPRINTVEENEISIFLQFVQSIAFSLDHAYAALSKYVLHKPDKVTRLIISFIIVLSIIILLIRNRSKKTIKSCDTSLILLFFYLIVCLAIGYKSGINSSIFEGTGVPRYESYSIYISCLSIVIIANLIKDRYSIISFAIVTFICCLVYIEKSNVNKIYKTYNVSREINASFRLIGDNFNKRVYKTNDSKWLETAINEGFFKPDNRIFAGDEIRSSLPVTSTSVKCNLEEIYLDEYLISEDYIYLEWYTKKTGEKYNLLICSQKECIEYLPERNLSGWKFLQSPSQKNNQKKLKKQFPKGNRIFFENPYPDEIELKLYLVQEISSFNRQYCEVEQSIK